MITLDGWIIVDVGKSRFAWVANEPKREMPMIVMIGVGGSAAYKTPPRGWNPVPYGSVPPSVIDMLLEN